MAFCRYCQNSPHGSRSSTAICLPTIVHACYARLTKPHLANECLADALHTLQLQVAQVLLLQLLQRLVVRLASLLPLLLIVAQNPVSAVGRGQHVH